MKVRLFPAILLTILFAGACYANPIVVGVPYGGNIAISTNLGLIINLAADFVALCLGFLIIRNIKAIIAWRFLPYLIIVFLGGIVLDVIAILPIRLLFYFVPIENMGMVFIFLTAGILLYFFNSWLSDVFFDLEDKQKITIGLVMALLTNPVIGWLFAG